MVLTVFRQYRLVIVNRRDGEAIRLSASGNTARSRGTRCSGNTQRVSTQRAARIAADSQRLLWNCRDVTVGDIQKNACSRRKSGKNAALLVAERALSKPETELHDVAARSCLEEWGEIENAQRGCTVADMDLDRI
jgi:hypothetical protein